MRDIISRTFFTNWINLWRDHDVIKVVTGIRRCGKTTLLRMIIGFNSIEGGTFKINGRVINDIPTNKRNIGMVFQNYAVFPHMNVFDNVAFGLRNRKLPKDEIQRKVNSILQVVKIAPLKDRTPPS